MHYAFDTWLAREFPAVWFERYADEAVTHCVTKRQATEVLATLMYRMEQVGLRLHPDKTRIVYCNDGKRRNSYEHTAFTSLSFTFRARRSRDKKGEKFLSSDPEISKEALKRLSREARSWHAGWMPYYGRFRRSGLDPLPTRISAYLVR